MNVAPHAPTALRWLTSLPASSLHAAHAHSQGRLISDDSLAASVAPAAHELRRLIAATGVTPASFWRHLLGLSLQRDGARALAEGALVKALGTGVRAEQSAGQLAAILQDLWHAVDSSFPELVTELELRCRPLREQWDARGPGLMRRIGECTDPSLIPSRVDVALVQPATGGGGGAHLFYNSVRIEAVLANVAPELPEVVRLGWLTSQLEMDRPMFSEAIAGNRLPQLAALAMVPPALVAAEVVELARWDPPTLERALQAWQLEAPADVPVGDILSRWWETYRETRPRWDIALRALDQMLGTDW